MGRRTLLVIASLLVAAAGTALVWMYVQSADSRARRPWQEEVTVLVATDTIGIGSGSKIVAERTEERQVPRKLVPAGVIGSIARLGNSATVVPVLKDQYLVEAQFASVNAASVVPDGHVGISVSMADPNRVASLLRPESLVAVYAVTVTATGKKVDLLFGSARVIGVGGSTVARNPDGGPARVGTQSGVSTAMVTLDLTPAQGLALLPYQGESETVLTFLLLGKNAKAAPGGTYANSAPPVRSNG